MQIVQSLVGILFLASPVFADTIFVPAGGDIQAAIVSAADGDVIQLEAGNYQSVYTIDMLGRAVALLGVIDEKTGTPTSILDGQGLISVLQCSHNEGADTLLMNLVITGGLASGGSSRMGFGGGLLCQSSSPTVRNCIFEGNSSVHVGGGVGTQESEAVFEHCTFANNSALWGGGLYNEDSSNISLDSCVFQGNSANWGGGMYNFGSSSPTVFNCAFADNIALSGTDTAAGGIQTSSIGDGSPVISESSFCSNQPIHISGAWSDSGGNCFVDSCVDSNGDGMPDACKDRQCPADFNGDDYVDAADLDFLLVAWLLDGVTDLTGDGITDAEDLGLMLVAWGECSP